MAGPSGRSQSLSGTGTLLGLGSLAAAPFRGGASLALGAGALGAGTAGGILGSSDAAAQSSAMSDQNYLDSQLDSDIQAAAAASEPSQQAKLLLQQYIPQSSMGALSYTNPLDNNGNYY